MIVFTKTTTGRLRLDFKKLPRGSNHTITILYFLSASAAEYLLKILDL